MTDVLVAARRWGWSRRAARRRGRARRDLDLAVLGLAALRDVEVRHDLEPGDQRLAEGPGDALVLGARAVDAQADDRLLRAVARLDVDVGRAPVGVDDDLVGEPDHRAVVVGDLAPVPLVIDVVLRSLLRLSASPRIVRVSPPWKLSVDRCWRCPRRGPRKGFTSLPANSRSMLVHLGQVVGVLHDDDHASPSRRIGNQAPTRNR